MKQMSCENKTIRKDFYKKEAKILYYLENYIAHDWWTWGRLNLNNQQIFTLSHTLLGWKENMIVNSIDKKLYLVHIFFQIIDTVFEAEKELYWQKKGLKFPSHTMSHSKEFAF